MSETNEQTYSKQIVYTAQVKSTIEVEGSTRDLTVIIPVPNGNLWIADCPRARNLTLINRNGKKIKQSDNLCSSTISYAVGYDTEILALCISEKTVFSLSSEGKKLENFYESSRYFPNGICVTKDLSVILSLKSETSSYDSDTKVIKIGRKGEVIWTVQTDTNGGLMFARPMQAIELDNGNIIVVDNYGIGGCKVVGLNREGDVLFKNEVQVDRMPFYIDRITQKDNRLFAIYQKKNKILLLNASGAEIRCLMDERCINPKTITVDYEGNILLGCRYGTIHIIEYQETVVTGHVINEFSLQGDSEEIALLHQKHDELYTWRNKSNVVQVTTLDGKITKTVYLKPALSRAIYIQSLSISPVDGSFWYALSTGRIQHVGLNNEKLHCITTYEGRKKVPMALRVSQNELLIAGLISGNKIIVLDMNGKEIRDIEHDNIVMDEPPFHIDQCCKTGNFAFPCGSHSICVTNENFEHIYTLFGETMLLADGKIRNTGYKCTRKFQPWFYCYDMDGNLVVSDENSLSVLLFSTDGHFIETITREIEWQRRPCGVGPNSDGTLWIAHYNGDIKQIRYKRADTKTLRKKKQKKTFAEVDMQDIRELRKSKETIAEMVKEEETMTPVKRRKRKLSTGKIGEQSRKEDKELPKGTPKSNQATAKKLDPNTSEFQADKDDIKSKQNDPSVQTFQQRDIFSEKDDIVNRFKNYIYSLHRYTLYNTWVGYVPKGSLAWEDINNVRIVALFDNKYLPICSPPKTFEGITIYWRQKDSVSREAIMISELENIRTNRQNKFPKETAKKLFEKHSNLTIIHPSTIRSRCFETVEQDVDEKPCIALYCHIKGIIPLGEKEFDRNVEGLPVDVREGFCRFNAGDEIHPGSAIKSDTTRLAGTVGAFVEDSNGTPSFITASHVVVENPIRSLPSHEKKKYLESNNISVYRDTDPAEHIGHVTNWCFRSGDEDQRVVDAALVRLNEPFHSIGDMFPKTNDTAWEKTGYSTDDPPKICTDKIITYTEINSESMLDSRILKYGRTSTITSGTLILDGVAIKVFNETVSCGHSETVELYGLMGVTSTSHNKHFSEPGDSGALCCAIDKYKRTKILPFGMLVAGNESTGIGYISLLEDAFKMLNLDIDKGIKLPPNDTSGRHFEWNVPPHAPDNEKAIKELRSELKKHNNRFDVLETKMNTLIELVKSQNAAGNPETNAKSSQPSHEDMEF